MLSLQNSSTSLQQVVSEGDLVDMPASLKRLTKFLITSILNVGDENTADSLSKAYVGLLINVNEHKDPVQQKQWMTIYLVTKFLINIPDEEGATTLTRVIDSLSRIIVKLFSSNEQNDFEQKKLNYQLQQVLEMSSQTKKVLSDTEELNRINNEQLQKQFNDLQEKAKKINQLEETNAEIHNSLLKYRKDIQSNKARAEAERDAERKKLIAYDNEMLDKKNEIKSLECRLHQLEETNADIQNSLFQCREDIQSNRAQAEAEREADSKKLIAYEKEMLDKKEEIKNLECRLNEETFKLQKKLTIMEQNAADNSNTSGSYEDSSATPALLANAVHKAQTALLNFCKCLQKYWVKVNGDPDGTDSQNIKEHHFARPAHAKFALQHQVCEFVFAEFEKEDLNLNNGFCTVFDMKDLAKAAFLEYKHYNAAKLTDLVAEMVSKPDKSKFLKFYLQKLRGVTPAHLEPLYANSNIDFNYVLEDEFCRVFLELSQAVWALHKLVFSFRPPARIMRFERFSDYNSTYMESLLGAEYESEFLPNVGLMTMPGFQVKNSIIRSKIYPLRKEHGLKVS